MSFSRLLTTPVTIVRAGSVTDRYGDNTLDWDSPSETDTYGWLTQLTGSEVLATRDAQVSDWRLYLQPDTDIVATDRVVAAGITYEVTGPPHLARTPTSPHHLEVALRAVVG